jgi:hypothetical protein
VSERLDQHLPDSWRQTLKEKFPRYYLTHLNELPQEEAAALGLGITLLLLAAIGAAAFGLGRAGSRRGLIGSDVSRRSGGVGVGAFLHAQNGIGSRREIDAAVLSAGHHSHFAPSGAESSFALPLLEGFDCAGGIERPAGRGSVPGASFVASAKNFGAAGAAASRQPVAATAGGGLFRLCRTRGTDHSHAVPERGGDARALHRKGGSASSAPACAAKSSSPTTAAPTARRPSPKNLGARVVPVAEKGYGSALRGGIAAASGKWIIMGDADDSYDFSEADRFVKKFQEGYELVMGCRLPVGGGTILPGAMPWKNRWIGNPGFVVHRPAFFQMPGARFSLRPARVHQGRV